MALGKFDALHIGHRELAIQASKAGTPFLLSFVRMAEILGWEYRFAIIILRLFLFLAVSIIVKNVILSVQLRFSHIFQIFYGMFITEIDITFYLL